MADEITKDQDTHTTPEHSTTDLEMADEIKKDQGFHECEVSTSADQTRAEADLHKQYRSCQKNPGHKDFIPVNLFNIEHIPTRYRDIDMLNFNGAMIYLTVHICCRWTSEERPETFPGTDKSYPFYNKRGRKSRRYGTGMVRWVGHYVRDEKKTKFGMKGKTCLCEICRNSTTPMTQWYEVRVITAQHVVFDSIEAKHTTCQLFYDSDEEKNKIQEFKGETTSWTENINYDMCRMVCYIHDLELGKKLEEMVGVFHNLYDKLLPKFSNSVIEHPLTVIVSHPHGCNKQVTIGEIKHREEVDDGFHHYKYTTQTCPGSSGAPVFVVENYGMFSYVFHAHTM